MKLLTLRKATVCGWLLKTGFGFGKRAIERANKMIA
jgi:hypothetical protein